MTLPSSIHLGQCRPERLESNVSFGDGYRWSALLSFRCYAKGHCSVWRYRRVRCEKKKKAFGDPMPMSQAREYRRQSPPACNVGYAHLIHVNPAARYIRALMSGIPGMEMSDWRILLIRQLTYPSSFYHDAAAAVGAHTDDQRQGGESGSAMWSYAAVGMK
jgi:hypothetical protein